MARKTTCPLAGLLKEVYAERRFAARSAAGGLAEAWREAAGPDGGEAVGRKGDVLLVRVEDPTRRYELLFSKAELLRKARARADLAWLRDVRFTEG